jgi:hypothetical protein
MNKEAINIEELEQKIALSDSAAAIEYARLRPR